MKFAMPKFTQERGLIGLTALVLIVGAAFLITGFIGGSESFDDEGGYESARAEGKLPEDAPKLPACAKDVELTEREEAVSSISFTCTNTAERTAFIALIKSGFTWNVFVDGERITLGAVMPE